MNSSKSDNDKNVVFLTNILPPYRLAVFRLLSAHFRNFKILLSAKNESNRGWDVNTAGLNIEIQKNISLIGRNKHPSGFEENGTVHIPFDTLSFLYGIRPDVIISAEFGLRTLFSTFYKIFNSKVKLICYADLSIYTESGRGIIRLFVRKFILKFVDTVIVNGKAGERYIRDSLNYKGIVHAVPYPSDSVFLNNFKVKNKISPNSSNILSLQMIYVGQLIPRKGLIQFIDELSSYVENKEIYIKFVLVGEGELKQPISVMGCKNLDIVCAGNVDYEDLFNYYLESDLLVLPTLADTWALVVNEAMACGVPVLGSIYSQAVEELIEHGVNGWVYDPLKSGDLCGVLDQLVITDLEKLDEISLNSHLMAKEVSSDFVSSEMINAIDL